MLAFNDRSSRRGGSSSSSNVRNSYASFAGASYRNAVYNLEENKNGTLIVLVWTILRMIVILKSVGQLNNHYRTWNIRINNARRVLKGMRVVGVELSVEKKRD